MLFWFRLCKLEIDLAPCAEVSIVEFEQVNAGWDRHLLTKTLPCDEIFCW